VGAAWVQAEGPLRPVRYGGKSLGKRRIAERVRDAAQAIEAGLYHNPGVHVAIMNTRDSRSTGFHWVVIMHEIRGRGH